MQANQSKVHIPNHLLHLALILQATVHLPYNPTARYQTTYTPEPVKIILNTSQS